MRGLAVGRSADSEYVLAIEDPVPCCHYQRDFRGKG